MTVPALPDDATGYVGKFNVTDAKASEEVTKTPVHWPYIGFTFANNASKAEEESIYTHMSSFIDFCGENLEEVYLDMYLEDNAPGVNSLFEQFARWYFSNNDRLTFRWKKTDGANAWVIYHKDYTDVLHRALEFSPNGDYTMSIRALNLSLKLIDEFQQYAFKSMSPALYDCLLDNDYFGVAMSRHL